MFWLFILCTSAQLHTVILNYGATSGEIQVSSQPNIEINNQSATNVTENYVGKSTAELDGMLPDCFKNTVRDVDRDTVKDQIREYFSVFNYGFDDPVKLLYNRNQVPMQCYFGVGWECDAAEPMWNEFEFTCSLPDSVTATFQIMAPDEPWGTKFPSMDLSFTYTLTSPGGTTPSEQAKNIAKNIATARIFLMQNKNVMLKQIYDSNQKRKEKNLRIVDDLFGLSKTWMIFLGFLGTCWCGWCFSITMCCDTFENNTIVRCSEKCNNYDREKTRCMCAPGWWDFLLWLTIALIFMFVANLNKSIVALFLIMFCYFMYCSLSACFYGCLLKNCFEEECPMCKCCMDCFRSCELRTDKAESQEGIVIKTNLTGKGAKEAIELDTEDDKANRDTADSRKAQDDVCYEPCSQPVQDCANKYWFNPNVIPEPLHKAQRNWMIAFACLFFIFGLSALLVFLFWKVDTYTVYSRMDQTIIDEVVPMWIAKGQGVMFTREGDFKDRAWDNWAFNLATLTYCSTHYNDPDIDKKKLIQEEQIEQYKIDMSIYNRTKYYEFETINDWFYRHLRDTRDGEKPVRPIHPNDDFIISSADCRVVAFDKVPDDEKVWLKNRQFTVRDLLEAHRYPEYSAPLLDEPSMVILRLAPQDYHRYHIPVSGKIVAAHYGDGDLALSVNFDAMTSGNLAIYNKRIILYIQATDTDIGMVGVVLIGAVCTGSINLCDPDDPYDCTSSDTKLVDREVKKGDGFGYYAYGGSTIALLFEKDKVIINQDLRYASAMTVEHLIQMGTPIARVNRS